ncbi:DUF6221 family protein [[Kitasatospora] papulosa]|uniref:DUF6221 family protein n=1 Tax=[Kitasatospora] papulosa TaxID=1464011 RepID=UPI0036B78C53
MDDLVQFLRDCLNDDEQAARTAKPGPWHDDDGSVYASHPTDEVVSYTDSGAHIARHDPARVLREVEAKRALLSRYEAMTADVLVVTGREAILSEYRRIILPGLALPYADRPDYQETWKP